MRIKVINAVEKQTKKLKTCAYCRVSTRSDEQALSLENQTSAYERLIKSNSEYEFVFVLDMLLKLPLILCLINTFRL